MPLTQIAPPYPIFTDKNGDPLDAGYLYFGTANLNPETSPIQVYYDSSLTQPAAQPIRTSNGYPMRNGSPALLYANSQFSVTVRDKNNALVIYSPVGYGIISGTPFFTDQMTYNQGSVGAVTRVLTARLQDYVSVKDFGAVGDGVTDDTAALNAAASYVRTVNGALTINPTNSFYLVSDTVDLTDIRLIDGRAGEIRGNLGAKPVALVGANSGVLLKADIWLEVRNPLDKSATAGNIGIKCLGMRASRMTYSSRGFDVGLYFDGASGTARNWVSNKFFPLQSFNNGSHVHIDLDNANYFIGNRFDGGSYYIGTNQKVASRGTFKVSIAGTAACAQNVVNQPEIGIDGGSQDPSHAAFVYVENDGSSGANSLEFLSSRLEGYGIFATDLYYVNVASQAPGGSQRFSANIELISTSIPRFLVEVGDLNNNSVYITSLDRSSPNGNLAQQRVIQAAPEAYQTSVGVYVTNRIMYNSDFTSAAAVITNGVSARETRAIGDGTLVSNRNGVGFGLRYRKLTGTAVFLSLPVYSAVAVICYDAAGAVLSGTSPYYARGSFSRAFTIFGRDLYQAATTWLWIHPDVAFFDLITTPWTAGARLSDVQDFFVEFGDNITPVYSDRTLRSLISSTSDIRSYYLVGTSLDGTATNGWRNSFYLKTAASSGAASGATAIDAASVTGITNGDNIGIELDTTISATERQFFHTTVSSVVGSTINLGGALPANASAGRTILINRWVAR